MGVQFQSYSWMCVGGKYIAQVFEGLLERIAEKGKRSKGEGDLFFVCFFTL